MTKRVVLAVSALCVLGSAVGGFVAYERWRDTAVTHPILEPAPIENSMPRLSAEWQLKRQSCTSDAECVLSNLQEGNCCEPLCTEGRTPYSRAFLSALEAQRQSYCTSATCQKAKCVADLPRLDIASARCEQGGCAVGLRLELDWSSARRDTAPSTIAGDRVTDETVRTVILRDGTGRNLSLVWDTSRLIQGKLRTASGDAELPLRRDHYPDLAQGLEALERRAPGDVVDLPQLIALLRTQGGTWPCGCDPADPLCFCSNEHTK